MQLPLYNLTIIYKSGITTQLGGDRNEHTESKYRNHYHIDFIMPMGTGLSTTRCHDVLLRRLATWLDNDVVLTGYVSDTVTSEWQVNLNPIKNRSQKRQILSTFEACFLFPVISYQGYATLNDCVAWLVWTGSAYADATSYNHSLTLTLLLAGPPSRADGVAESCDW